MTCSSLNRCFGLELNEDVSLEPQILPVQIQQGMQVRWVISDTSCTDTARDASQVSHLKYFLYRYSTECKSGESPQILPVQIQHGMQVRWVTSNTSCTDTARNASQVSHLRYFLYRYSTECKSGESPQILPVQIQHGMQVRWVTSDTSCTDTARNASQVSYLRYSTECKSGESPQIQGPSRLLFTGKSPQIQGTSRLLITGKLPQIQGPSRLLFTADTRSVKASIYSRYTVRQGF